MILLLITESLKKTSQFRHVYSCGKSRANRLLVVYTCRNNTGGNRLGICASRKVGKSVVRSRVVRLIRESYRTSEKRLIPGFDIVVVARAPCSSSTFWQIRSAQLHLLGKHGLLINSRQ